MIAREQNDILIFNRKENRNRLIRVYYQYCQRDLCLLCLKLLAVWASCT